MKHFFTQSLRANACFAACLVWLTFFSLHASAADLKLEAENAVLNGVRVESSRSGFSGTGYVEGFDNSIDKNITFSFQATAGLYDLSIRYTTPNGEKGYVLIVNDERSEGMFTANAGFASANAGKFLLREGRNTITIGGGWGWYGIDFISLSPATVPLPVKPPKQLIDARASRSTKNLFSFMVDLYGTKVLAAQQEYTDVKEIDYVREHSGKEPAIGAYDLMEYSPSRIQYGGNADSLSEKAIAWAKKEQGRGIISLMWHWNAPTDLINEGPDKHWYFGFYTRATTFDLAAVLADKEGERYKLLIRDIDSIAVQLKKFQDNDLPVLWRPLHEAAGTWFWWGAKGPAPFKELWRIMYERLTNHHQLHNLIWVYTAERGKAEWYPGDEYVDIVGLDIYENTPLASNLSGPWSEMQDLYGGKKLVTLSETGNLPNPDYIRSFGTWWSWFAVWNGNDYIRKQSPELIHQVFNDQDIITLDELPDWRNYEPLLNAVSPGTGPGLSVYPNPVAGDYINVSLNSSKPQLVTFTLLSTTSSQYSVWHKNLEAGSNKVLLEANGVKNGLYILLIRYENQQLVEKLILNR